MTERRHGMMAFDSISMVKHPPDPLCRVTAIVDTTGKPTTPTMIEHDPDIECPSCGGKIVERAQFRPGTPIAQARLFVEEGKTKEKAISSKWVCLHCGHEEKRF